MPELPEVEQVRKTLMPHIVGKEIKQVEVRLTHLVQYPSAERFAEKLAGKTIESIERRGKYLRLNLGQELFLLVHLRMTGALLAVPKDAAEPPYAKIKFELGGDENLWFTDIRTFGTLYLIDHDDFVVEGYATLGPEPGSRALTKGYLLDACRKHKKPIKTLILDQKIIAGLGNIYADEALFVSGICPERSASELTELEVQHLVTAINKVIRQGIKNKGTTFRDYKDGEGNKGSNQEHLYVYGRRGQACKCCGTALLGAKIGGRGTTYCPQCQK